MNRERDHDKERRKRELAHEAEWSDSFLPFDTSRSVESEGLENKVRSENEVRPQVDRDVPVIGSAPFSIESMLFRYQDYQLLAEGGQGQVYRAFDPGIGRNIAVKVLRPDRRLSSRYIDRFRREARLTGRLDHPGICPVYDVGELEDGSCYYTMKEVSGLSLQDLLNGLSGMDSVVHDGSPMLSTFSRVCEAIEFAHARGVIHRDLKPGNIMVGLYGEVYVIDWGLAKEIGEQEASGDFVRKGAQDPFGDEQKIDMTRDGAVLGTLGYMPPEQADGRVDEVDERSDIYSLGAILYEVLSLRCPFRGVDRTQILHRVLEGDLIPVSQVNQLALISSELESVVYKAMEHDPALRYQTVRELREDIEAYLEGRVLSAARYHPGQRLQKWLMRNLLSVTVSVILVASLSLAWGASLWVDRIELRQRLEDEMIQARSYLERAGDVRELSQLPGLDVVGRGYGELRELSVRREGALRKYGSAARALERAIQLDPDYSEALALRRTVGDTIGWMALAARDYLMSYLAFSQLVRFGVPKE
ncbi:MAG: protein kinase, partial [Planctomycetota bacterium]|nr:protein kinase [Planctomycetota bacterium]